MKTTKTFAVLASLTLLLVSCRETVREETVVREVEKVEVEDEKGILENTAEEVDKEVNEEINEEIEKIGDDK